VSQTAEHVRDNIVKIVDGNGAFNGTGFLIDIGHDRYCITCHHCIYRLNEIHIARDDKICPTVWQGVFARLYSYIKGQRHVALA